MKPGCRKWKGIVFSGRNEGIARAGVFGTRTGEFFANKSVADGGGKSQVFTAIGPLQIRGRARINNNSNPQIMKRIITTIAALVIGAMSIQTANAAKGDKKPADPEAAWAKISGGKDSVTKAEFTAHAKKPEQKAKLEAQFDAKDTDKDGKLTKAEFLAKGGKKKKNT